MTKGGKNAVRRATEAEGSGSAAIRLPARSRLPSTLGFTVGFGATLAAFVLFGSGCGQAPDPDRVLVEEAEEDIDPLAISAPDEPSDVGNPPGDASATDPTEVEPGADGEVDGEPVDGEPIEDGSDGEPDLGNDPDPSEGPGEEAFAAEPSEADLEELQAAFPPSEVLAQPEFGGGSTPPATLSTEWTWFHDGFFDYAPTCMDGSATGMGMSLVEGAEKTLIFFQSGGACFNGTTCLISDYWLTNDQFDEGSFGEWSAEVGQFGMFDRENEANPYRDYNFVFFPYCSGDVFGGRNFDGPGGRAHLGYRNVGAYMDFLDEALTEQSSWVVTGSSAGGFGAAYNFSRIQHTLAPAPVTLLSDSAPVFSNTYARSCLQEDWRNAWSLDQTFPVEFEGDIGTGAWGAEHEGLSELLTSVIDAWPNNEFAFVTSDEDTVLRFFYGIGHSWGCSLPWLMSKGKYRRAVQEFREDVVGEFDNVSVFVIETTDHTFLNNGRMYNTTTDGVSLTDWLAELEDGEHPGTVY